MQRCLQLASLAAGQVAPNPMVGAVLVYDDRIIGEGFHRQYGGPHAEVNCFDSVLSHDEHLVQEATLYVSLEPCSHTGKTPPCADLCIHKKVKRVVIGCRDPFPSVSGKGIEKLVAAGIEVEEGMLEESCRWLNRRFLTFHEQHRPYVILKWAQSDNGRIAGTGSRVLITNEMTNRLVHRWRSEEAAILAGTNTVLKDDPQLSVRLVPGRNPVRLIVDMELRLPGSLKVFDGQVPTIVFNTKRHTLPEGRFIFREMPNEDIWFYQVTEDTSLVDQLLNGLYMMGIQSVLVEGGARLLQSFIDAGTWDEARVITNTTLMIPEGLAAPVLGTGHIIHRDQLLTDHITTYRNQPDKL